MEVVLELQTQALRCSALGGEIPFLRMFVVLEIQVASGECYTIGVRFFVIIIDSQVAGPGEFGIAVPHTERSLPHVAVERSVQILVPLRHVVHAAGHVYPARPLCIQGGTGQKSQQQKDITESPLHRRQSYKIQLKSETVTEGKIYRKRVGRIKRLHSAVCRNVPTHSRLQEKGAIAEQLILDPHSGKERPARILHIMRLLLL